MNFMVNQVLGQKTLPEYSRENPAPLGCHTGGAHPPPGRLYVEALRPRASEVPTPPVSDPQCRSLWRTNVRFHPAHSGMAYKEKGTSDTVHLSLRLALQL